MNTQEFIRQKKRHKKWVMVTAYDTPTAEILDAAGVDFVLVGGSVGMVVLGYPTTNGRTTGEKSHHAKAVRRGTRRAKLIGDLPLSGITKGAAHALESAQRFIEEARCDAVKLEWGRKTPEILRKLVRYKIPVMGHVGLTPDRGSKIRF